MGNVAFTRDEAILALDTLYSAGGRRLRPDDEEIIELSRLLNELPVIPLFRRGKIFRNCSGVCNQLNSFNRTFPHGKKDPNVGEIFYLIADEFCNNKKELGLISDAIKRNSFFFENSVFGSEYENLDFPEGALMEHLHKYIERRDSRTLEREMVCDVCKLNLAEIYKSLSHSFNELHLLVPVTELDVNKKYKSADFITVCPNCHAMLHRHRPWLRRENVSEILR